MARTRSRLTAIKVASIKKPGLYADGGSLYLRVAQGGSKGWIFRFTLGGRTRDAGLGSYPTISLVKARESADECRRQVAAGIDPIETRNEEQAAKRLDAARALTFEQCAKSYMASHEVAWKNDKHRAQWRSTLATYAFPVIGALPVKAIDTQLVLKILEPIWTTKPETASRVRGHIEVILSWAKVRGYRDGKNPAQWRGHLDHLLPAKGKVRKVVHHAALPYSDTPAFLNLLRRQSSPSARTLEFLIFGKSHERSSGSRLERDRPSAPALDNSCRTDESRTGPSRAAVATRMRDSFRDDADQAERVCVSWHEAGPAAFADDGGDALAAHWLWTCDCARLPIDLS